MKVLLDTHALVWWLEGAGRLSRRAATILANLDNSILVSAVVGWEIAIKVSAGKMQPRSILQGLDRVLEQQSFSQLPITLAAAVRASLPPPRPAPPPPPPSPRRTIAPRLIACWWHKPSP